MGNVSSSYHPTTRRQLAGAKEIIPIPAKVVTPDGRLEEFRRRTTAEEAVSGHPSCYLCSSDSMAVGSAAPRLPEDYVLQFGQIYFILPLSKVLVPLSLQDLCVLAIKASVAIGNSDSAGLTGGSGSGRVPFRKSSLRVRKQGPYGDFLSCPKLASLRKIKSLPR
ncbi:ribonucleoside-diphosphate reductase subunit beta [Striga asiatica]|uniref:Ribonucleoside-diphosphate reductase subunit beta n=1 Tax=Striga asiatica TaxID=4170 RepID=A0A5A7QBF4_STRAF|nr:ribonucleoside-diphosphate reductase subunit beta [Striga asiatica]